MSFSPLFGGEYHPPVRPPLQEGIWAGVSPWQSVSPWAWAPAPKLVDRALLVGEVAEGGGGETVPVSRRLWMDTYIRGARNMHWNNKTFPQKLFLMAWRHVLTKIHLQKAGRVLLCTSVHAPFLLSILQGTEMYSQKGHQEAFGLFCLTWHYPTQEIIFFFRSSCVKDKGSCLSNAALGIEKGLLWWILLVTEWSLTINKEMAS